MNYLTAPDCVIWTSVIASAAVPVSMFYHSNSWFLQCQEASLTSTQGILQPVFETPFPTKHFR